jgi:polysaccharide biosynthesis protein PslH
MAQQEQTNTAGCKVLSVVWYKVLPPKYGGQKAVAYFNEYLAEQLSLILLCSKNNEVDAVSYPVYNWLPVSKLQFLNPFVWRQIYQFVKKEKFTHLILEFPYYGVAGILCQKLLGVKLVVNTHNIEFIRFKQQKKWWWGLLFHFEKWVLKNADAVFFKTDADEETARKYFGISKEKTMVVPYGVEEKSINKKQEARQLIIERHSLQTNSKLLLFAGTLDYLPNAGAVEFISQKLIPLLKQQTIPFTVLICGRNQNPHFQYLNQLASDEMILTGNVDDIENYFLAADVFIDPVVSGGGIQTKIMDALSYHLDVVCYSSKAKEIKKAEAKIFAVTDHHAEEFVNAIVEALHNRKTLSPAFFEKYNWRTIAAKASKKIKYL